MRVLILGNAGYIGPVVVAHFRKNIPRIQLVGFDTGYFAHCLSGANRLPETMLDVQYWGDIRNLPNEIFEDINHVVYLAA